MPAAAMLMAELFERLRQPAVIDDILGLSLGVATDELYGIVLFMAVATTLITPPFLKRLFAPEAAARGEVGQPDASGIIVDDDLSRIG